VLSGEAASRIRDSGLEMLTVTNSISPSELTESVGNIRVLDVSALLADAMDRIHNEKSVSSLFD
jgi:ribose-phosphate pyrophosphokinase